MDWKFWLTNFLIVFVIIFMVGVALIGNAKYGSQEITLQDLNSSLEQVRQVQVAQLFLFQQDHNALVPGSMASIVAQGLQLNQAGVQCLQETQGCQLIQDNNTSRLLACPPRSG